MERSKGWRYHGHSGQSWEEKGQPSSPEDGHQPGKGSSIYDELILQTFLRKSQQFKRWCLIIIRQPYHDAHCMVAVPRCRSEIWFFEEALRADFLRSGLILVQLPSHTSVSCPVQPRSPSAFSLHRITGRHSSAPWWEGCFPSLLPQPPQQRQQPWAPEITQRRGTAHPSLSGCFSLISKHH